MEELDKLDLPPVSIASFDLATESIPSTCLDKKRQTKLKITEELVAIDHDGFEDFSTPLEHLIKTQHVLVTTSASTDKKRKTIQSKKVPQ